MNINQVLVDGVLYDLLPSGEFVTPSELQTSVNTAVNKKLQYRLSELCKSVVKYGLGTQTMYPSLDRTSLNPGDNWKDPSYRFLTNTGSCIWRIESLQISDDGQNFYLRGEWSQPIKLTGDRGVTGAATDGKTFQCIFKRTTKNLRPTEPNPSMNIESQGWTDNPTGVSAAYPYEWTSTRYYNDITKNTEPFSSPALWAKYSIDGDLTKLEVRHALGTATAYPTLNKTSREPGEEWKNIDYKFTNTAGKFIWRTEAQLTSIDGTNYYLNGNWSEPIRLTGDLGLQGPSANAGVDGNTTEFIFTRTITNNRPVKPNTTQQDDWYGTSNGVVWTDSPVGVSKDFQCEWVSLRTKKEGIWSDYSTPSLWAKWGDVGEDGDGIQYVFTRTKTYQAPSRVVNLSQDNTQINDDLEVIPNGWTDNPKGISQEWPYEWVMKRKYNKNTLYSATFSDPSLWAKWSEDGVSESALSIQVTNDNIHLDDNTPQATLKNTDLSKVKFNVYKGSEKYDQWTLNENPVINGDLEISNALSYTISDNTILFTYKTGISSFDITDVKYCTYTFKVIVDETELEFQINIVVRNITNGENYILTADPGAIIVNHEYTTFLRNVIRFSGSKIENGETSAINLSNYVLKNLSGIGTLNDNSLVIPSGTVVNSPITIGLCKNSDDANNDIYLDSETIELSIKGQDGTQGESYSVVLDNDNVSVSKTLTSDELRNISRTTVRVFKNNIEIQDFSLTIPQSYNYTVEGHQIYLNQCPSNNLQVPITVTVDSLVFYKYQTVLLTPDVFRLIVSPLTVLVNNNKTMFISNPNVAMHLEIYKNGTWEVYDNGSYTITTDSYNWVSDTGDVNLSTLGEILDFYRIEAKVDNQLVDWEEIQVIPLPKDGKDGKDGEDGSDGLPGQATGYTIDVYIKNDNIDLDDETSAYALENTNIATSKFYVQKNHSDLLYGSENTEYFTLSDLTLTGDSEIVSALNANNLGNGSIQLTYKPGVDKFDIPVNSIKYATLSVKINYSCIDTITQETNTGSFSRQINILVRNISTGGTNYDIYATPGSVNVNSDYAVVPLAGSSDFTFVITGIEIPGEAGEKPLDLTGNEYRLTTSVGTPESVNKNVFHIPAGTILNAPITIRLYRANDNIILAQENIELSVQGASGTNGSFKSFVFKRSIYDLSNDVPKGGTYNKPVPTDETWTDGAPSGTEPLWMSWRLFTTDDSNTQWTTPVKISDENDIDYAFSSNNVTTVAAIAAVGPGPGNSTDYYENGWTNYADENTVWMAIRKKSGGIWGPWTYSRIKGEDGESGASVRIVDTNVTYLVSASSTRPDVNDSRWVANPTDIPLGYYIHCKTVITYSDGTVLTTYSLSRVADDGSDGQSAGDSNYLHIAYASDVTFNNGTAVSVTNFNTSYYSGAQYIGIYVSSVLDDSSNWADYNWSRLSGTDGKSYEYIYKTTTVDTQIPTPSSLQQDDYVPSGWTDDPSGIDGVTAKYEWVSQRTKTNNVWSNFSVPSIWAKWSEDGISSIVADLDNDSLGWACDENSKALAAYSEAINARMYNGTDEITSFTIYIKDSNNAWVTTNVTKSNITASVNNHTITVSTTQGSELEGFTAFQFKLVHEDSYERYCTLSISGIPGGGQDAVLYSLLTSDNIIKRLPDGTYSPSTINCSRYLITGNGTPNAYRYGDVSVYIENTLLTNSHDFTEILLSSLSSYGIDTANYIKFVWTLTKNGNTYTLDSETVPIIEDGQSSPTYKIITSDDVIILNAFEYKPTSISAYVTAYSGSKRVDVSNVVLTYQIDDLLPLLYDGPISFNWDATECVKEKVEFVATLDDVILDTKSVLVIINKEPEIKLKYAGKYNSESSFTRAKYYDIPDDTLNLNTLGLVEGDIFYLRLLFSEEVDLSKILWILSGEDYVYDRSDYIPKVMIIDSNTNPVTNIADSNILKYSYNSSNTTISIGMSVSSLMNGSMLSKTLKITAILANDQIPLAEDLDHWTVCSKKIKITRQPTTLSVTDPSQIQILCKQSGSSKFIDYNELANTWKINIDGMKMDGERNIRLLTDLSGTSYQNDNYITTSVDDDAIVISLNTNFYGEIGEEEYNDTFINNQFYFSRLYIELTYKNIFENESERLSLLIIPTLIPELWNYADYKQIAVQTISNVVAETRIESEIDGG